MSEPFGNKWKKIKIWPPIQTDNGKTTQYIKINTNNLIGTRGSQGPQGNPNMQLTSPDGTVYQLTVTNEGLLETAYISGPQGSLS